MRSHRHNHHGPVCNTLSNVLTTSPVRLLIPRAVGRLVCGALCLVSPGGAAFACCASLLLTFTLGQIEYFVHVYVYVCLHISHLTLLLFNCHSNWSVLFLLFISVSSCTLIWSTHLSTVWPLQILPWPVWWCHSLWYMMCSDIGLGAPFCATFGSRVMWCVALQVFFTFVLWPSIGKSSSITITMIACNSNDRLTNSTLIRALCFYNLI